MRINLFHKFVCKSDKNGHARKLFLLLMCKLGLSVLNKVNALGGREFHVQACRSMARACGVCISICMGWPSKMDIQSFLIFVSTAV